MKLFLIANTIDNPENSDLVICDLLKTACDERGIPYEILDPRHTNPLKVNIQPGDALYRVATASAVKGAAELERALINPQIVTFHTKSEPTSIGTRLGASIYEYLGIPAPKTVGYLPKDRKILLDLVNELGGFPIIIKAMGGSHGVGVMRVDSPESLFSVSDFVCQSADEVLLKEYCDVRSSARLIVLGDCVISSIEYSAPEGDFRSNEGVSPNVVPKIFDDEIQRIAVHATNVQGLEFGGVDIMLTPDGPKVAEVNFPCFFPRCQLLTGDDIAGQMVDYLAQKSQKVRQNPPEIA